MPDEVLYEMRDRLAYVTLNRPHAMNAVDPEMHAGLLTFPSLASCPISR